MQLSPKHSKQFCPIGCKCRDCRQLQHSGLGFDRRKPTRMRTLVWRAIFTVYLIATVGAGLLAWGAY